MVGSVVSVPVFLILISFLELLMSMCSGHGRPAQQYFFSQFFSSFFGAREAVFLLVIWLRSQKNGMNTLIFYDLKSKERNPKHFFGKSTGILYGDFKEGF